MLPSKLFFFTKGERKMRIWGALSSAIDMNLSVV